jgi:dTDP-glucose 4,6-dehydratase
LSRLLITGGAGFIGCNYVQHRLRKCADERVVVLDALTYAGNLASLSPVLEDSALRFVHGNIGDQSLVEDLLRTERIDTIVHFAAESHVDRSIAGPDAFIETNVIGTHALLKAARQVWLEERRGEPHRFHHVSTDEVYGSLGPEDAAFTETTPYAPNSPYSASKAASDHIVRAYHHTYGLRVTTSNCSNNYGPYQFPEKLIPLAIVNIFEGRAIPVYGDGRNVRDWLHVADHCDAIDRVLAQGQVGETYNIGGRSECQNIDLIRLLCSVVDQLFEERTALRDRFPRSPGARDASATTLIEFVRDRPGHDRRYAIDCAKAARILDYAPSVSLRDGLLRTVIWYVENEPWWREVMSGTYRDWIDRHYRSAHGVSLAGSGASPEAVGQAEDGV